MCASQSQAITSWPGGLVVSSRRYSARRRVASSVMLSQLGACRAVLIRPPAAPPGRQPSARTLVSDHGVVKPRRAFRAMRTLLRRLAIETTTRGAANDWCDDNRRGTAGRSTCPRSELGALRSVLHDDP